MNERSYYKNRFLADTPLPTASLIEILGNRRLLIENHKGIISYGCDEIRVKAIGGIICVDGGELSFQCISKERIVVIGRIDGVRICCEGDYDEK